MYGVLIVDDERYVRLWIRNCIRWEEFGFGVVGEAEDGGDALDKLKELNPRLVISDMEMPDMDGTQLIEKASGLYPDILFLVLSGYNTFEYMRSAVKNNAVDYLLKPVDKEDITPVLEKIRDRLELEDKKKEERARTGVILKENLEHRREKFLTSLLEGRSLPPEEVRGRIKEFGIPDEGEFFNVLSIRFDEEAFANRGGNPADAERLRLSIADIAQEVLSGNKIASSFLYGRNEVISIINYNRRRDGGQGVAGACRQIIGSVNRALAVTASIGMGNEVRDILDIGASCMEARKALDLTLIYGDNNVLTFLNVPISADSEVFGAAEENAFAASIAALDYASGESIIAGAFERLRNSGAMNVETIKMVYYRLVSAVLKEIYRAGITPSYLNLEEIDMFTAIKNFNTLEQIRDKLLDFLRRSLEGISNTQKIKNSAVEKAKEYIRANYKNEITLADISRYVHMTPNYFSTLFKAETGHNVLDYITRLRIEEVMSLMKDKNLKTYEIGEMVGYKEPKYFCRVFKKVLGQSPLQYRKQLLKGIN